MNVQDANLLIDAIVRQTVVLVAHIATSGGKRTPLADVADQVFRGLIQELEQQGVTQTVTADMFGMALRTYQRKRQRLTESATERGRTLWEALLSFIQERGPVQRADILRRFHYDGEDMVRGVLSDLVEAGFVARTGRGHKTAYLVVDQRLTDPDDLDASSALLWITIYRKGPLSKGELRAEHPSLSEAWLDGALEVLERQGAVRREDAEEGARWCSEQYLIPFGAQAAWGASVFDHYQAMVGAICTKLRHGQRRADLKDTVGGSTFAFDLWEGHPDEEEVLGLLKELRERAQALRLRAESVEAPPEARRKRVLFYVGQNVMAEDEEALAAGPRPPT